jgi:hypothetical protein
MRKLLLWGGVIASVLASMSVACFGVGALVGLDLGLALKSALSAGVLGLIGLAILVAAPRPHGRPFFIGASIALGLLIMSGSAFAQTAPVASTSIDFSSIIASVENVVFGLAAAAFAWLGHRVVSAIETWTGTQLTALHGDLLNGAITEALGLARNKLDATLQGKETVDVHNQLAATAAQLVVTKIPDTLAYLGISQAAVIDKIKGLLGIDLSPIQTVTIVAPAPTTAAPTLDLDGWVKVFKAAITQPDPATPPAPAPLVLPA